MRRRTTAARRIWAFESQHIQQRQLHRTTITALAMTTNKYDTLPRYQYDTLPKDAFRLLTIIDADYWPVKCTLSTFSLDNPPAYMALSYTWGSALPEDNLTPDPDRLILCDGAKIAITMNLGYALCQMELTHEYIWVDAVCINQQDLAERSAQVALMGRIYSQASQVKVWLGIADRSTKTAFDFILDVASRVPEEMDLEDEAEAAPYFSGPGLWDRLGRPEWTTAERQALSWLFLRNWFTRTWVIQEVVFASDPVVLCGSNSAPWRALSVVSQLASYQDLRNMAINEVDGTRDFLRMSDGFFMSLGAVPSEIMTLKMCCREVGAVIADGNLYHETASLLNIAIRVTRNLQATEPRDKVFAPVAMLLHVFPFEELIERLRPEYSKSISQVFTEASSFLLQHKAVPGRGYLLAMAGNAAPSQVEGLPSWVQDYTVPAPETIMLDTDCKFNCIAGIVPDTSLEFTPSGSTLRLHASRLDIVAEIVPLTFYSVRTGSAPDLLQLLQFAAALPDFDASGGPAILSMIHSLAVNCTRESDYASASDRFREMFTQFLRVVATEGEISDDEESVLIGLLDDLERRGITAFPTCAQLRDAMEGPEPATIPEDEAFKFVRNNDRRLFQSTQGYLGVVPITAQSGDEIVFLPVSEVPFVFRKTDQPGEYKLVGEAYVHGVMYGELWREGVQPEWSSVTLV